MTGLPTSLAALRRAFAQGELSPSGALHACRREIDARNGQLNALMHFDWSCAEAEAEASALRWRQGRTLSPVDGAPMVVKANCAIANLPLTAALKPFAQHVAKDDSEVVARLRAAGAIIVGAANMHEAALGATTTSPLYGPCFNPLRAGFTPGGSSGGSAAAVAAGFCLGAVGTDTMGSVRIPSAHCGVVGFKPSYGRISKRGVIPLSQTLDHVGFHARCVSDVRALYAVTSGFDLEDSCSTLFPTPAATHEAQRFRVGVVNFGASIAADVAGAFQQALDKLQRAGLQVQACDMSNLDVGRMRRRGLLICEAELLASFPDLLREPDSLSNELAGMLEWGARQTAPKLAGAYSALAEARRAARQAFSEFEVLIAPTAAHTAAASTAAVSEAEADLTVFANFAGLPALCLPIPAADLPASLQVMGPFGEDERVLDFAASIEDIIS